MRRLKTWWKQTWCKHDPKRVVDLVDVQTMGDGTFSGMIEHHHYECLKCGKEGKTEAL